jgi:dihydroneopterin aldolase
MADTLDYAAVHKKVIEVGRGKSYRLLETFARKLIDELLASFACETVTVRVRKETPVLDGIVDAVGVQMSRSR